MARAARGQQTNDQEPDDEVEPDEDDQEEDDQEDEGDDEGDDYKPPTAKEWAATQAALKKANTEAKRFRTQLKNARRSTAGESSSDQQAAEDRVAAQWKPRLVKSAARAALAEAGAKKHAIARLARSIDLDSVEVDDDGEVDLEDQIEELKEDLPELFDDDDDEPAPRRRKRLGKTDAGAKGTSGNGSRTLSSSEKQARAILGR